MKDSGKYDKSAAMVSARNLSRRSLLRKGLIGGIGAASCSSSVSFASPLAGSAVPSFGALQTADANGLMLPPGFTSRVVATTGSLVAGTGFVWHGAPDGGATFGTSDGGWIYVSNAELSSGNGGVGAIRFNANGDIVDAYSILGGTARNCAGGPTPWNTWLSCEETGSGEVWECDPYMPGSQGVVRPDMGKFNHEAAAVDPLNEVVYLTEDRSNGLLYRFIPATYPDLSSGTLEAAEILDPLSQGAIVPGQTRGLAWHVVPDPTVSLGTDTRFQVASATTFNGGEGCWYENKLMYFTTKGDNRVWRLDTETQTISITYQLSTSSNPELSNVDNVYVSPCGDVFVAEDPGNLQIVALTDSGIVKPVVQLTGVTGTEITGPALSPDGSRMYFSSQRNPGKTFEVTGPWLGIQSMNVPAVGNIGLVLMGALLYEARSRAQASKAKDQVSASTTGEKSE